MRNIRKGKEPASLTEYRCKAYSYFDGYQEKDDLRESLVREQRGLCCYCMSRIFPQRDSMRIEHWHSQSKFPQEELDYANLLGACPGHEGERENLRHCDTRKGEGNLSRNPANPLHDVERWITYLGDGTISSIDSGFDRELNDVLNLNVSFLKNNRKQTLDAFTRSLGKGTYTRQGLERLLKKWNGELDTKDLEPFCQVIVYWLRKRLARGQ